MRGLTSCLAAAALIGALVLAGVSSGAYGATAAKTRPNIVLVMTDDQRWDTLWAMPTVRDALQGHGTTFSNAFVVNPLCCPSRASVLTGRYSHSTGVYLNQPPNGGFASFDDSTTIATRLHDSGYETALVGKYLNGYGSRTEGRGYVPPGWDYWTPFSGFIGYYDYRLYEAGSIDYYGSDPPDYSTDLLRRKAVSFLRTATQPFFLEYTPYAPHAPATPPARYESTFANLPWWRPTSFNESDLSDKPRYIRKLGPLKLRDRQLAITFLRRQLASALAVDDAVRAILRELERRHALRRTFIVFTSDNGIAWGEHVLIARSKSVPYEETIRVPLVVRYDPMTDGRPRTDGRLALNIDLAPTFAALAGTRLPQADGRSMLPLLTSEQQSRWRHDFLFEHLQGPPEPQVPTYCGIRTERYKYVLYQTGEEELYDLFLDPRELTNRSRSKSMQVVKRRLHARLAVLCQPPPPGFTALER